MTYIEKTGEIQEVFFASNKKFKGTIIITTIDENQTTSLTSILSDVEAVDKNPELISEVQKYFPELLI